MSKLDRCMTNLEDNEALHEEIADLREIIAEKNKLIRELTDENIGYKKSIERIEAVKSWKGDEDINDKDKGLYQKYIIQKADGSDIDPNAVYFVLRLDKDSHAQKAAVTYQKSIMPINPRLAHDLQGVLINIWDKERKEDKNN